METIIAFVAGVFVGIGLTLLWKLFNVLLPWKKAFLSGARVSLVQIVGMRLRGNPVGLLVDAMIILVQRGHRDLRMSKVEQVYLAEGSRAQDALTLANQVETQLPPLQQSH